MFYYLDENNQRQGPFPPKKFRMWYERGYLDEKVVFLDKYGQTLPLARVLQSSDMSTHDESVFNQTMNMTMNMTNLDVTLPATGNLKASNSTIYEAPSCTQLSFFDENRIPEEPPEVTFNDVRHQVILYIDRRPLVNMKRRFTDTFLPFESGWPEWGPLLLSVTEALTESMRLSERFVKLDYRLTDRYLKSINIQVKCCEVCSCIPYSSVELMRHVLSFEHVENVYHNSEFGLSSVDVFMADKMADDIERIQKRSQHIPGPTNSNFKPGFLSKANVEEACISMKSGFGICQKIPMMILLDEENDSNICEYIEAVILLRRLDNAFTQLNQQLMKRHIGPIMPVRCGICEEAVNVTFIQTFYQHIFSEKHLQIAIDKGISRIEVEYWLAFLEACLRPKMPNESKFLRNPEKSLQQFEFPLCVSIHPKSQEFKFSGEDAIGVIDYVKFLFRTSYTFWLDDHFRTECEWCGVDIMTKSQVIKHILFDKIHFEKLGVISNEDLRMFLGMFKIKSTVPLFKIPATESLTVMLTDARKERSIERLKKFVSQVHSFRIFESSASFPLSLVNHCEICNVELEELCDILPHLVDDRHWKILIEKHQLVEEDFDFWFKIFGVSSGL